MCCAISMCNFTNEQNDRGIKTLKSSDLSVSNTSQKMENGNGWGYTGNNFWSFTHNLGLAIRIFFCDGYFGSRLFNAF